VAICATVARHRLDDLDLFAIVTGNEVADVHEAVEAAVGVVVIAMVGASGCCVEGIAAPCRGGYTELAAHGEHTS
jgi:hypothetical protein